MSVRNKFIKTLRRNGVEFKEVQTESGLALQLQFDDNGNKSYDAFAFVGDNNCKLEIHTQTPIHPKRIQDVQLFLLACIRFTDENSRFDINSHGIYRIESWLHDDKIESIKSINDQFNFMFSAMDNFSPFIEAINKGVKTRAEVAADFLLYAVKKIIS